MMGDETFTPKNLLGTKAESAPAQGFQPIKGTMETTVLISRYQVDLYRGSPRRLEEIAVAFTGSPKKSRDEDKVVLLNDPLSSQTFFYEFRASDIIYAEEASNLSMPDGSAVSMVRVWIKKGSTGLKIEPFHVQDTSANLKEFF